MTSDAGRKKLPPKSAEGDSSIVTSCQAGKRWLKGNTRDRNGVSEVVGWLLYGDYPYLGFRGF